jgi:hypothetical protein
MHLHWKYRELVKILVKAKSFADVKRIALSLEAESGGILVSVDKVSKGYAIVVFRGKNYRRPSSLRPRNLLSKRKALARSIELQRHQVLFRFCCGLLKVQRTYVGCSKQGNRLFLPHHDPCYVLIMVFYLTYIFFLMTNFHSSSSFFFRSLKTFLQFNFVTGAESSFCKAKQKGGAA